MAVNDPHSVFHHLVPRYLSGDLTGKEKQRFQDALKADPGLRKELEEYGKIWDSADALARRKKYDLDAEWKALKGQIPAFEDSAAKDRAGRAHKGRTLLFYTYRIAAVLVIGLLFSVAWVYSTHFAGTVRVAAGNETLELTLDDGSRVVLNRDSRMRYPKDMNRQGRKVALSGEAWFQVARDTLRPFTIDAGAALVEVLGTKFNVNAYKENPVVEITVESGIVALSAKADQHEQIVLKAGNSGTYDNRLKALTLVQKSDPNNLSWKTRNLYFEHSTLEEVAALLTRVYHVQFRFGNPGIRDCPITVTFRDQSLDSVLNVLRQTLDLQITRSGDVVILDGTGCVQ